MAAPGRGEERLQPGGARRHRRWARAEARQARGSSLVAHDARFLAVPVALLGGLALVVQLLALRERQLELRDAACVEIKFERNERHALALDRDGDLVDFLLVQQQAPLAPRLVLEEAPGALVLGDVGVD